MENRKGQINIEFIGGFLLFTAAVIFIFSSSIEIFAEFNQQNKVNELGATLTAMSNVFANSEGYWENNHGSGKNWHENLEYAKSVGLLENGEFSDEKFSSLDLLGYDRVKEILGLDKNFWIEVKSFYYVEARNFEKGNLPREIVEPNDKVYEKFSGKVNYGSGKIFGKDLKFLVILTEGSFRVYVSENSDFRNADILNSANKELNISGKIFRIAQDSIIGSRGKVLMFEGEARKFGLEPPKGFGNILGAERFAISDKDGKRIVKISFWVWK